MVVSSCFRRTARSSRGGNSVNSSRVDIASTVFSIWSSGVPEA